MESKRKVFYQCEKEFPHIDNITTKEEFDRICDFSKSVLLDVLLREAEQLEIKDKLLSEANSVKYAQEYFAVAPEILSGLRGALLKNPSNGEFKIRNKELNFFQDLAKDNLKFVSMNRAPALDGISPEVLRNTKEGKKAFTQFAFYLYFFVKYFASGEKKRKYGTPVIKEEIRRYIRSGEMENAYNSIVRTRYGRAIKPFQDFNIPQLNGSDWEAGKNESFKKNSEAYFKSIVMGCGGAFRQEFWPDFRECFERMPLVWKMQKETRSDALEILVKNYFGSLGPEKMIP